MGERSAVVTSIASVATLLLGAACSSKPVPPEASSPSAGSPAESSPVTVTSNAVPPPPITHPSAPAPSVAPSTGPEPLPSPSDVFAAKIALLDRIDDAVIGGKADALAALALPESALATCDPVAADRARSRIEVSKDCVAAPGETLTRFAINVGSRTGPSEGASCLVSELETSELFYRVGGRSLKLTIHSVAAGQEVHLQRIRCHRSRKASDEKAVRNCAGKWPFVTQTREFPPCPWDATRAR